MNLQAAWLPVPLISNLAAFLAAALFARLHRTGPASGVITGLLALPGGAPGAVLALFLFDRKARKETMLLRVFLACLLAAQLALLCFFLSFHVGARSRILSHQNNRKLRRPFSLHTQAAHSAGDLGAHGRGRLLSVDLNCFSIYFHSFLFCLTLKTVP